MSNDLILKRQISINCWNIEATISKEKERNELMFLLMFLRDNPHSTALDLSNESFFDTASRVVVAERLLNIAKLYGLVEQKTSRGKNTFTLAEDGKKALETKQVFVPEEGTWTILASDDPLLPFPILSIEAFNEPNAISEVHSKTNEREFEELPAWVTQAEGNTDYPCLGKQVVRFDDLKPKAEKKPDKKFQLEWNISQNILQIKGDIESKAIDKNIQEPAIDFRDIWRELLINEDSWEDWDDKNQVLAVEFKNTKDPERQSMFGDFIFEKPHLEQFGRFEKLEVNRISLTPLSMEDAQLWAEWRLKDNFNDYATKSNFSHWRNNALKPFSDFSITLPDRHVLAGKSWVENRANPTPTSWHLVAAEDWYL